MFSVSISEKGGPAQQRSFEKSEVTIGRVQGNDIVLPKQNVSKRHARIVVKDGKFIVVDLKSTNGTYVNGRKISSPQVIKTGDKVYVGDFVLSVNGDASEEVLLSRDPEEGPPPVDAAPASPPPASPVSRPPPPGEPTPPPAAAPPPPAPPVPAPEPRAAKRPRGEPAPSPRKPARRGDSERIPVEGAVALSRALREVAGRVAEALPPSKAQELSWEAFQEQAEDAIYAAVDQLEADGQLSAGTSRDDVIRLAIAESAGHGCLEDLLQDDTVLEIMVNGPFDIFVQRGQGIERIDTAFSDDRAIYNVACRLVGESNAILDPAHPIADVRRKDGSRVRAVIPPVSVRGTVLTVKKAPLHHFGLDDLVAQGALSAKMADFLEGCVRGRKNLVVVGGPGSGKTTMLGAIGAAIPKLDRVITVEEAAELRLPLEHCVALETRPADVDGHGGVGPATLVSTALRLRPDRLVIGDLSAPAALAVLRAMAGSCSGGVLCGMAAVSPDDAASRLETLCLMGGNDLPARGIREQIASAVDVIVVVADLGGGERRVTHITCLKGIDLDLLALEDVFTYQHEGFDEAGGAKGSFAPTGFVPGFFDDLQARGILPGRDMFRD